MNRQVNADRFTARRHRSTYLLGYLLIFGTALRRINELDEAFSIALALVFIGCFTVLYATEHQLSQRFRRYPIFYFTIQMLLVQILGVFEIYMDTWAMLYIVLGFQVAVRCSRKAALIWWGLFIVSILGTLFYEFGFLSGLGRGMAYIVIGVFFISFDSLYAQREVAQEESRVLLEELQTAHAKLKEQALQTQQLAALQERSRITQEMHDAVGQKVFAIQLMAEATGALLEKDPARAAQQLHLMQEQTQAALGQMRQLISRWRFGPAVSPSEGGETRPPSPPSG